MLMFAMSPASAVSCEQLFQFAVSSFGNEKDRMSVLTCSDFDLPSTYCTGTSVLSTDH